MEGLVDFITFGVNMGCNCKNKVIVPTPTQMVKGMVGISKNFFGIELVDSVTASNRTEICNSCTELNKGILDQCRLCSCVIAQKVKQKHETCPLKKW